MKRVGLLLMLLLVLLGGILWFVTRPAKVRADQLPPHVPDLQNGRTMFNAGGCPSCHAPNRQERNRLSGGAALKSPFGTFYAPNISPHATDGIGRWSEADFVTAMQEGTSPDGHHYYPTFPFTSYRRMRLTDVRDLFAYLKTLPAVEGRAKDHELPAFARMRWTLGFWKLLFLHGDPVQADASRSEAWNRGAYLANGPGHCSECHSPRNVLGAIISSQRFAGAPDPDGSGGWIANITQAGIRDYSEEDIARVLESGELPNGDSVGGAMRAVVRNTAELSPEDRYAIATYIKSLPPIEGPKRK
jgi:mono/diheme cytochrome c family protein